MPCAVLAGGPEGPAPSSCTDTRTELSLRPTVTAALAPGPACLRTLVSDSCTIRYTVSATPGGKSIGSTSSRASSPPAFSRSTSSPRSASPGGGLSSASASGRRTARTCRISASACRLAAEILVKNPGTASGFVRTERVAASAWIVIKLIEWPMTSCSSRAIRSRSSTTARAVVEERLRIARELHDVIGHSISLITIQAEAATRSVRTNPDAVPGFLTRISAASRQALAEMRHVLAVLRPDAEAEISPQPGLADLGELAARLNAGGLETRLDVEPMDLSPGVALTVYRIVQESLTNVLKHAGPGARAVVTVVRSESSVRVSVHDDGAGPSGPAASTARGIVGMCERAAVYGGTLRTGARAGGGFEDEALIPMREEAP